MKNTTPPSTLSLAILCIVNELFVIKYSFRVGAALTVLFASSYAVFFAATPVLVSRWNKGLFKRRYAVACAAAFTLALAGALRFINVETIMNDRWSVINAFFGNLFSGVYPYLAQSNQANQPGPFPFYFVLAFPFYLLGDVGFMVLCSFAAFFAVLARRGADVRTLCVQTLLLVTSPALMYEVIARSTVFFNMALIVLYLFWLEKDSDSGRRGCFWPGVVGGLLLSTRAIAALPLACYLSYDLLRHRKVYPYAKTVLGMGVGFCLTFTPLLLWGWHAFTQKNPIFLQSAFSPLPVTAAFVALSVGGGLFVKSFEGCLRLCGILLFLIVATSTVLAGMEYGWYRGFFDSKFDISYFIFSLPFLAASIRIKSKVPT
jgi:hypothetical protein